MRTSATALFTAILVAISGEAAFGDGEPAWLDNRPVEKPRVKTDYGYVFIDGQYLPPPYAVQADEHGVFINRRLVYATSVRPVRAPAASSLQFASANAQPPSAVQSNRHVGRRLLERLEGDCALVVFRGEWPVLLDAEPASQLLDLMTSVPDSRGSRAERIEGVLQLLPPWVNHKRWTDWLNAYYAPTELQNRWQSPGLPPWPDDAPAGAKPQDPTVSTPYYMSVLGIVLTVIAFGHLLASRPQPAIAATPELLRGAVVSIGFVAGLSGFDLAWTIINTAKGTMQELNPIATSFVDQPAALVAYKAAATLLGCSLLFFLRHRHFGRLACWWMCLVCTIVTLRWTVFHSMIGG